MSELKKMKEAILADGVIDAEEVKQLEAVLYDDGEIDKEEAELIFELNDAVSGKENDASWESLFVRAISDFLLKDEKSPGEIDDEEAAWLKAKIEGDGQLDALEYRLLHELKSKAKVFPDSLAALLS